MLRLEIAMKKCREDSDFAKSCGNIVICGACKCQVYCTTKVHAAYSEWNMQVLSIVDSVDWTSPYMYVC